MEEGLIYLKQEDRIFDIRNVSQQISITYRTDTETILLDPLWISSLYFGMHSLIDMH